MSYSVGVTSRWRRWAPLVVWFAYVALTAYVAFHHEPWRDETDTWLFARDASLETILERSRYAGFPGLWFLIVAIPAKLGLPYASVAIVHLAIAAASAGIVLFRAPWRLLTRVAIVFSYFFAYEYAVVVRSYALSTLGIVWAAASYRGRHDRPWVYVVAVAILGWSNVPGFFFAASLAAVYLGETILKRQRWIPAAVMSVALAAAFIQLVPPADADISGFVSAFFPVQPFKALAGGLFPQQIFPHVVLLAVAIAVLIIASASDRWEAMSIAALVLLLYAYLFALKFPGALRHHGFMVLLLLFLFWIGSSNGEGFGSAAIIRRIVTPLVTAIFLLSWPTTVLNASREVRWNYSGSLEMARQLAPLLADEGVPLAGHSPHHAATVLAYLPEAKMWFPAYRRAGTFVRYDREYGVGRVMPIETAARRTRRQFQGPHLLLLSAPLKNEGCFGYRLLFKNSESARWASGEMLYLYAAVPGDAACIDGSNVTYFEPSNPAW